MRIRNILFTGIAMLGVLTSYGQNYPYQDASLSSQQRAEDLCSRLTLEEKVSLMMNGSPAIPRLGIKHFDWWNEALHGVGRNGYATVYPATIGMAASFDDELLYKVFTSVSDEARAKNVVARRNGDAIKYQGLSFWTPNLNIFRDPRWGRGQETYGEDPYLTSMMGLAVVRGLQGPDNHKYRKLLACAKHYAVHSGPEWNRHEFNIESLPERDLWETYLPAFETLVKKGHVAEVMCAYQRIDGQPCCGNDRYLQHILRDQWGFDGIVTSDCGAIDDFWREGRHGVDATNHEASAHALRSGTDVECGGNYKSLVEAVQKGEITEAEIDKSLIRLLKFRFELGDFDPDEMVDWTQIPESVIASKEHKAQALRMAQESIVLLQNDGILPLSKTERIAVMGPNANDSVMQWANYSGFPTATVTLLQGIQELNPNAKYVNCCGHTRNTVLQSRWNDLRTPEGLRGMKATYWNNMNMEGTPVATQVKTEPINLSNGGATVFAPGVSLTNFSARYEASFTPTRSETVVLNLAFDDGARLIVNGDTIKDVWKTRNRIQYAKSELNVEAGKEYKIQIDFFQRADMAVMNFDICNITTPTKEEILAELNGINTIVFAGGISPNLEGEEMKVYEEGFKGGDRTSIELPRTQREMIAMLSQAGKKIIFINCSGSAVALEPESQNSNAILQAWSPGEQGGTSVASVLFGDCNPSGKLPVTFYRNTEQLPDFLDYTMKGRTYRYFTGKPLWPFGHGLSYTTFKINNKGVNGNSLLCEVTNTGKCEGTEVVQLYVKRVDDTDGPAKSLRGYQRVTLKPGETQIVKFDINDDVLTTWDKDHNIMRALPGEYQLMVGSSSDNVKACKYKL
ncbi:MAG: glycoside hydrolase family 3 C-terminal domain-containing protein [Prevotella sp.]|nr:glycoside hydrolase family 3 C-terminal domain-containing protein [Prevotella sp.]